jgi:hypothetical protein
MIPDPTIFNGEGLHIESQLGAATLSREALQV